MRSLSHYLTALRVAVTARTTLHQLPYTCCKVQATKQHTHFCLQEGSKSCSVCFNRNFVQSCKAHCLLIMYRFFSKNTTKYFGMHFKKGNADMLHFIKWHFITHQRKKNEMVHCSPLIHYWHSVYMFCS